MRLLKEEIAANIIERVDPELDTLPDTGRIMMYMGKPYVSPVGAGVLSPGTIFEVLGNIKYENNFKTAREPIIVGIDINVLRQWSFLPIPIFRTRVGHEIFSKSIDITDKRIEIEPRRLVEDEFYRKFSRDRSKIYRQITKKKGGK